LHEDDLLLERWWSRAAWRRRRLTRNMSPDSLRLPNEASKLHTLGLCAVCAVLLTVLWVFFPLLLIAVIVPLGIWYPVVLAVAPIVITIVLFVFSTRETRRLRELAGDL